MALLCDERYKRSSMRRRRWWWSCRKQKKKKEEKEKQKRRDIIWSSSLSSLSLSLSFLPFPALHDLAEGDEKRSKEEEEEEDSFIYLLFFFFPLFSPFLPSLMQERKAHATTIKRRLQTSFLFFSQRGRSKQYLYTIHHFIHPFQTFPMRGFQLCAYYIRDYSSRRMIMHLIMIIIMLVLYLLDYSLSIFHISDIESTG